tara:strand:- start:185 stop:571 length:387 start_codon:yes stop_codon:yes gene_type:complete
MLNDEELKFNQRIGKAIKTIRITTPKRGKKYKYMTQTTLANLCGITFQQIQKYEKGSNSVSPYKLSLIANAFNVSVHFILRLALGNALTFEDNRYVKTGKITLNENNEIIISNNVGKTDENAEGNSTS